MVSNLKGPDTAQSRFENVSDMRGVDGTPVSTDNDQTLKRFEDRMEDRLKKPCETEDEDYWATREQKRNAEHEEKMEKINESIRKSKIKMVVSGAILLGIFLEWTSKNVEVADNARLAPTSFAPDRTKEIANPAESGPSSSTSTGQNTTNPVKAQRYVLTLTYDPESRRPGRALLLTAVWCGWCSGDLVK
ncbi:hypothetical protein HK097_008304 [Rhizophlyctis rosea]|uniref:Uncharacterized protein n=1 Tax=Rhizophlyctis rosea TaxID=64517 RepID=A0AAD5SAG3_9FUNG|nr:hypothetical protein HK097_008304 [Rhizophlyctis rosea]